MESNKKSASTLGTENIKSLLIKMSIPAIIGMLVTAIYNIVDTLFVSQLGTSAVGAASIAYPLFMLIAAIGLMFGIGSASYISRLLGAKDIDQANKTVTTTFVTGIIVALLLTGFLLVFIEPILILFGASDTILAYAIDYSRVLAMGSVFTILNMIMNNILRAEGSAKYSMLGLLTGAVLNIILDPLFIFTFGLGIKGAALATIFSQGISTLLLLYFFLGGKSNLKLSLKNLTLKFSLYKEILKIGIPTFFRQFLMSVSMALINSAAMPYGDGAVAAIGITTKVFSMGAMVVFGFSQGFQPIAGYNFGSGQIGRLKELLSVALKWASVFTTLMAILFIVFAEPIMTLFSQDPMVISTGVKALRALSFPLPFFGFQVIYATLFQSLGKGKEAGVLSLARQGFFLIPIILILPTYWGLNGVVYAQTMADVLTIILTAIFALGIHKEINHMVADESKTSALA